MTALLRERLLEALQNGPGDVQTLAREVVADPESVRRALNDLLDAGLLQRSKNAARGRFGTPRRYRLVPVFRSALPTGDR